MAASGGGSAVNEMKWTLILIMVLAIVVTCDEAFKSWQETRTTEFAMQNGYVQTVDKESGKILWVKDNKK